jgi:hypothetical protein
VKSCCRVLCLFLLGLVWLPASGETWYVRHDGGTRNSANHKGQCDGKADAAYRGSGSNQHCAFNDVRYLWTDGTYTTSGGAPAWGWIGAGGDTYLIRGGPWRVGQSGPNAHDSLGLAGDPYGAGAPPPPSGTPAQHTRILGENYESCGSQSKMTQLFGGYGVFQVLALNGAKNVDVQCIELTRHSQCVTYGVPPVPGNCKTDFPIDDYAKNGITTDAGTQGILLQDMWIHGFTSRGIIGPIGGTVTATRVDIAYNAAAGWDFDDGKATPNVNGVINLSYVTIEWSGCNQAYPGTGAISCYSQSSGGYGDGIGTPGGTCLTAHVDHSVFRYNTQDGYDMLHNDTGNCSMSITDSASYGNNGSQFKWGSNDSPMIFTNNLVVANCLRLSAPMSGQPNTYNAHLADFCRAEDAIALGFRNGGTVLMANNTIVTYSPTTFDVECADASAGGCPASTFTFKNNIVLGYDNPATYNLGGHAGGPGGFYFAHPIGKVLRSNNIYYGIRNMQMSTLLSSEKYADPKFASQPRFAKEQDLDNFDFHLSPSSPALGSGTRIPEIQSDHDGKPRPSTGNYDIGAFQH